MGAVESNENLVIEIKVTRSIYKKYSVKYGLFIYNFSARQNNQYQLLFV